MTGRRMAGGIGRAVRRAAGEIFSSYRRSFSGSTDFWRKRYKFGGTSGSGSYGAVASAKAAFVNRFVAERNVRTLLDMGCGDGNVARMLNAPQYVGIDVSPHAISYCRAQTGNENRKFYCDAPEDVRPVTEKLNAEGLLPDGGFDLTLSMDVIFHLTEDEVFYRYMDGLIGASGRHVLIQSTNFDAGPTGGHVRAREFTRGLRERFPQIAEIEPLTGPLGEPHDPRRSHFHLITVTGPASNSA